MICSLCPKVALYIAGKKRFCRDHRDDAVSAMVREQLRIQSIMSVRNYFGRQKFRGNMASGGGSRKGYHTESNSPVSGIKRWMAAKDSARIRDNQKAARNPEAA